VSGESSCAWRPRGGISFRELCRRFGISAPAGYKWLRRWEEEGEAGLWDRSRRPRRSPTRTPAELEEQVVELRRRHPRWGGRKIAAALRRQGLAAPAPSTVTGILRRRGVLSSERRHRGYLRFEHPAPNDLWQMDFKGHFPLQRGGRCHPFGILDDHSRYNLCLTACQNQQTPTVRGLLEATLRHYGLPQAILCDNGSPWGKGRPWTTRTPRSRSHTPRGVQG
jgi:transposase InsO family protein